MYKYKILKQLPKRWFSRQKHTKTNEMGDTMLGQIFQPVLEQMKSIIGRPMGVLNNTAAIEASVGAAISEDLAFEALTYAEKNGMPFVSSGYTFVPMGMRNLVEYIVYVEGETAEEERLALLLAVSLSNLQLHCADKYDKSSYLKNVLLGNVLPGDVYVRSGELQIDPELPRLVYIVQMQKSHEYSLPHVLSSMFPEEDFVIPVDAHNVVLIKTLAAQTPREEILKTAQSIVETVTAELMVPVYVGIGTQVDSLNDIARSYSEASLALEIGRVFDDDQYILSYDTLGIGRLIYQLPDKLCELFLDEIFKKESIDVLDDETLQTIYKFFENNLNVSETSRQLFVHRNTLVYRLDKIERLTGLDLRKFDDAVVFKVAILVNKYLNSNPSKF